MLDSNTISYPQIPAGVAFRWKVRRREEGEQVGEKVEGANDTQISTRAGLGVHEDRNSGEFGHSTERSRDTSVDRAMVHRTEGKAQTTWSLSTKATRLPCPRARGHTEDTT